MNKDINDNKKKNHKSLGYALKTRKYMHIGVIPIAIFLLKMTLGNPHSLKQYGWKIQISMYGVVILGYLLFYGIVNLIIYFLRKNMRKTA
ncbi:hypothetical protein [Apilactobacillus timberlakei]|uniref:hypothetical protein n=1 Tax=Apilactobacillus timberlakei TaxID=2008380 RepID=UPI00112B76CB|nr:hypothetical protein [Apilactobacillus timberlakei]TPR16704.1 hypothetical protein DYZ95_06920 [Apilactobacillus timberlakei]TPR21566.1 hypothetical protein DY083_05970 [Apilactobacillus timberlakei]